MTLIVLYQWLVQPTRSTQATGARSLSLWRI